MAVAGGPRPETDSARTRDGAGASQDGERRHGHRPHTPEQREHVRHTLARVAWLEGVRRMEKRDILIYALLVACTLLIVLNIATMILLKRIADAPLALLQGSADQVAQLRRETFTYTLNIEQDVPVKADVPINRVITVPINGNLPIDTTFNVPLNSPFGQFTLPVPIKTTVPISMTVQAPINETVQIDTVVPIRTQFPLKVRVEDTQLAPYLKELEQLLRGVR